MTSAPLKQALPGPGAPSVTSDDSSTVTRVFTFQDRLDEIQEFRERKSILGGTLSRPIKEYRKEDVKMHPPRPGTWDDPDEAYYSMYLSMERKYWDGELRAWESLLTRIQRRWEKRNKAAGGTVPPPPPVQDMDPLELHTVYLELVHEKVKAGANQSARDAFNNGGWHFGNYELLVEHFQAIERLVEEMQKDRGLTNQALTGEEKESHGANVEVLASASRSGGRQRKRPRGEELENATSQAGPASKKTRTKKPVKSASRKRKKTGGDEPEDGATPQIGSVPRKTRTQTKSTSAPPRSKRARDEELEDDTTQQASVSTKTRGGRSRASAPKRQSLRGAHIEDSASTSARRHSRRKAGLKPENGGL